MNKNLTNLKHRSEKSDDLIVIKELVDDNMFHVEYLKDIMNKYSKWVCIDGGGHIGIFSLLFSDIKDIQIHTFEPNPDSFNYLVENTKSCPSIRCYPNGIDFKNQSITLFEPDDLNDTGRWSMTPSNKNSKGIKVETINLEDLIKDFDVDAQILLKLDLEGYEALIIDNISVDTLKRVKILVLEEHHLFIDHNKIKDAGFVLLFHPFASKRHYVYFNVFDESPILKSLLSTKVNVNDKLYNEKIIFLESKLKWNFKKVRGYFYKIFSNK